MLEQISTRAECGGSHDPRAYPSGSAPPRPPSLRHRPGRRRRRARCTGGWNGARPSPPRPRARNSHYVKCLDRGRTVKVLRERHTTGEMHFPLLAFTLSSLAEAALRSGRLGSLRQWPNFTAVRVVCRPPPPRPPPGRPTRWRGPWLFAEQFAEQLAEQLAERSSLAAASAQTPAHS